MLEVKKVKINDTMSEETMCFTAELWNDGKLVAYISNHGHGGNNMVHPNLKAGLTYKDVAKYDTIDMECEIDELLIEFDEIRKNQSKGFFTKKGEDYYVQKFPRPITKMKKAPYYEMWLSKQKANIIADGHTLLNKNL